MIKKINWTGSHQALNIYFTFFFDPTNRRELIVVWIDTTVCGVQDSPLLNPVSIWFAHQHCQLTIHLLSTGMSVSSRVRRRREPRGKHPASSNPSPRLELQPPVLQHSTNPYYHHRKALITTETFEATTTALTWSETDNNSYRNNLGFKIEIET